jgi:hypothetical protein
MTDKLSFIDLCHNFLSICAISFIINLCRILLIGFVNVAQIFLPTKQGHMFESVAWIEALNYSNDVNVLTLD